MPFSQYLPHITKTTNFSFTVCLPAPDIPSNSPAFLYLIFAAFVSTSTGFFGFCAFCASFGLLIQIAEQNMTPFHLPFRFLFAPWLKMAFPSLLFFFLPLLFSPDP